MALSDSIKQDLLRQSGYRYNFNRMIFVHREKRKIFSFEAIEDNSLEWLQTAIEQIPPTTEWQFFFNEPPSDLVRKQLLEELG